MSSSNSNRSTGRAKSCVVCRQFKLKCDARKTAPDPCSRCVVKNLKCRFDPNFKRISTRKIAQEVADELHTLRAANTVDNNTTHSQLVVSGQSPAAYSTSRTSVSSNSPFGYQYAGSNPHAWIELSDDEAILDQSVYGVTVSSSRILKLLYHFEQYYYPHARFLPKLTSINKLNARCQLLLWTILVVSAERYEGYDGLYEQLCSAHDVLMGEVLHTAIQKLEVVHALLLLTLWPIPKLRNSYDPSWNYIGLAIQAAASLNCHSPLDKEHVTAHYRGQSDTAAADMEPSIQAMTWIYCFKMGTRLSAYLGLPPPMSFPSNSKSLLKAQQLAADILTIEECAQLKILEILHSAQVHLDMVEDSHAHYSMTEVYENQFDAIRKTFQENWSWSLEVQLQAAKMYMLCITFTIESLSNSRQDFLYQQMVLQKVLDVAASLISTMTAMSNQGVNSSRFGGGILTFYPKHYYTWLLQAAAVLLRFLIACRKPTQPQQSLAISCMIEAHKIFQSFPDHRDAMRACINIELYIQVVRKLQPGNADILITNRLGASVALDANFRAAQQRNRDPVDGTSPPVSQWSTMDEHAIHRLPLAPEQKMASPKSQPIWPMDSALGVWDTYSQDFGVINEPWLGNDAEFSMLSMSQQQVSMPTVTMAQDVTYGELEN